MASVGVEANAQSSARAEAAPVSSVPAVMQDLRRSFLRSPCNIVLFRSTDEVYETRTVPRDGPVWEIPRADHPLDYTYMFKGNSYTPDQFMDNHLVNAMLVAKDGKILFERYRNQSDADDRFIGFSMTKSITSVLIGCALAEGRIKSLDDTIETYLPELKGGGYEGVTIRQLLQMRSGIVYNENYDPRDTETYGPGKPSSAGIDNIARRTDAAPTVKRGDEPGSKFEYKNLNTTVLGWLIERVSGGNTIAGYM